MGVTRLEAAMPVLTTQLGPLRCRLVDRLPQGHAPAFHLVLCHGFGAPGDDLVSLAESLLSLPGLAEKLRCVFPEAPLHLDGLGYGARAWWQIDVGRIERAIREGRLAELCAQEPDGLARARRKLLACLDALCRQADHGWERLLLGGFSQGAMLTTDVALRAESAPAGLAILSGTLLCSEIWRGRCQQRSGLPVFQSHGRQDPLLPFTLAERLRELLRAGSLPVEFHEFTGGHGIPAGVLGPLARFAARHAPE